jgi:hypothetical protein
VVFLRYVLALLILSPGLWSRQSTHPEKYASILRGNGSPLPVAGGLCWHVPSLPVAEEYCKWIAEAQFQTLLLAGEGGQPYVSVHPYAYTTKCQSQPIAKLLDTPRCKMLSKQTRKPFLKYLLLLRPTGPSPPMLLKPLQKQRLTLYDSQNAFCKCFDLVGHVAPFLDNRQPFHILELNQTSSASQFLTNSPPEESSHCRSTFLSLQNSSSFEKRGIHTIR